jgi:hypothetical protein
MDPDPLFVKAQLLPTHELVNGLQKLAVALATGELDNHPKLNEIAAAVLNEAADRLEDYSIRLKVK